MKQFHTIAVLLLVCPNSGLTQPSQRRDEQSLDFTAQSLRDSPDNLQNLGTAFSFIDRICGQKPDPPDGPPVRPDGPSDLPDGLPIGGKIFGAYNSETGDFMRWTEYKTTVGKNGNNDYGMATGPWRTFSGSCSLVPESTWVESSYRSQGMWIRNPGGRSARRSIRIMVRLAGFTAKTSARAWFKWCEDGNLMARIFQAMPLPETIRTTWAGLARRVEEIRENDISIELPPRYWGTAAAATNVRTVHAKIVLNIVEWNRCYDDGSCSKTTGWLGMGGLWEYVYAPDAYVEGTGIVQMRPRNPWNENEDDLF